MKLRRRVFKLKDFLVLLLIALLTAGLIGCFDFDDDDDDDDDEGGASSGWTTYTGEEGVIKIDIPKSWEPDSSCEKDPGSGNPIFCELWASTNIQNLWNEWDDDTPDGIYVFISTEAYLMQEGITINGVVSNESVLEGFQNIFSQRDNCDAGTPMTYDTDGGISLMERYSNCGESGAKAVAYSHTSTNRLFTAYFIKAVSLTGDDAEKILNSIKFNDK